ncbi:hypothetical protein ABC304_02000 [Microbacterium sp. 1P10UB]|uniref:hypothetical protein n=1 Tax=unclassified Microbacterium TaxID=2609290 RepID=UPI0039A04175
MFSDTQLSQSDRLGMYLYAGVGAVGIGAVLVFVIGRLIEVARGRDIPVLVPFVDETAALPIGPGGAPVEVTVHEATVTVADPAAATLFALWAQPIVIGLAIIAGIVVAALFCLRLARGLAFKKGTSRLVYTGIGILAVGWFAGSILTSMTVNGALSAVSDHTYDGTSFEFDFAPVVALLALTVVATAFQVGERLQRETEGLV